MAIRFGVNELKWLMIGTMAIRFGVTGENGF